MNRKLFLDGGAASANLGEVSSPAHFEIPPEPAVPAPVAAPPLPGAKTPGALTRRRSGRDSDAAPRNTQTRHAKRQSKPQSNDPHQDDALLQRLANARVNGRCAADSGDAVGAGPDAERGAPVAGTESHYDSGCPKDLEHHAGSALSQPDTKSMVKANSQVNDEKLQRDLEKLKTPTDPEALVDGPAYVRAVAQHVDLVGASARLVVSTDEKVCKAELDRLRELIFGKGGPQVVDDDEPWRVDLTGFPRPIRNAPAPPEQQTAEPQTAEPRPKEDQ